MAWATFLVIFSSTLFRLSLKLIKDQSYFKVAFLNSSLQFSLKCPIGRGTAGDVIKYENNCALSSRYELHNSGICHFEM